MLLSSLRIGAATAGLILVVAAAPAAGQRAGTPVVKAKSVDTVAAPPLPLPNPRRKPARAEVSAKTTAAPTAALAAPSSPPSTPAAPVVPPPVLRAMAPLATGLAAGDAAYFARLDAALAPLAETALSPEDGVRIRDAVRAIGAGNIAAAKSLRGQIGNATGRRLVDWIALRAGFGEPAEFRSFLDANPDWPDRGLLLQRAEEQVFASGGSSARIKAFFADASPRTGAGLAALASAHLFEGDEAAARRTAAKAWREHELAASLEAGFLGRFKAHLSDADHRWRLDRQLTDDIRWSSERNVRAAIARRVLPLLSEAERKKAEARIAVFQRTASAGKLMSALPAEPEGQADWGLAFQRIQLLRRAGKVAEATQLMLKASIDPTHIANFDGWWLERRALAYEALEAGNAKLAYDLVREPGNLSVNPLKDAGMLAGWIALRLLKDAAAAERHFEVARKAADGPLSAARGEYWSGRALEALGRTDEARARYEAAARHADTFHGLLARQKLDTSARKLSLAPPAMPSDDHVASFIRLEPIVAVAIARKAGLDMGIAKAIIGGLRFNLKSEGELALLAHLAEAIGDTQLAVRIGKTAIARGFNLILYAYPVHPMPSYSPLREPPEPAMLLAIARQESEFNQTIVSGAGARGLLQVMPVTARHVCRDYKIAKCEIARLLTDNAFNASLASAYIADRMGEFSGSYVMTLAGYNAGPGRVRQWMREFGDPRDPKVDVLDWIERIPFEETREYVKKVIANVHVYRARLASGSTPLKLTEDLARGRR
jgi:soluble lytic murein transglycosylase